MLVTDFNARERTRTPSTGRGFKPPFHLINILVETGVHLDLDHEHVSRKEAPPARSRKIKTTKKSTWGDVLRISDIVVYLDKSGEGGLGVDR
jgi:hypothetical protein